MISIVIPAFNEEEIVAETVEKVREILRQQELHPFEIIVVDDGSTDQTAERAKKAGALVLPHLTNMGYGLSLKDGINLARFDTIVITDADGTYPLDQIPVLIKSYQQGFDMVIGARKGSNFDPSFFKRMLRWFLKWLVEFTTGRPIPDINSGLRVFSKKTAVPFFRYVSNAFSFTTSLTLAYMLSSKFVTFVPIGFNKRVGKAKVRLLRDALRTLQYITEAILIYNPIKLFLVMAVLLGFLAMILLALSLVFQDRGFLLLGTVSLLVSCLVVSLGFLAIQLKEILHSARRD